MATSGQLFEINMRAIAWQRHERYVGIFQLTQPRSNYRCQRSMINRPINIKRRRQRIDQHRREIDIVARAVLSLARVNQHIDERRGRAWPHASEDADQGLCSPALGKR